MKKIHVTIFIIGLCCGVSEAAECTTRGRFPNNDVEDCRGYTMCLNGALTNFTQYRLQCPTGSVYSHIEQQCTNSTNYHCLPTYNCTTVGNFANSLNVDCTSFIACPQGIGEVATTRLVHCSLGSVFSPTERQCVNETEFTCPPNFPDVVIDDLIIKSNVTYNNAINLSEMPLLIFLFAIILS